MFPGLSPSPLGPSRDPGSSRWLACELPKIAHACIHVLDMMCLFFKDAARGHRVSCKSHHRLAGETEQPKQRSRSPELSHARAMMMPGMAAARTRGGVLLGVGQGKEGGWLSSAVRSARPPSLSLLTLSERGRSWFGCLPTDEPSQLLSLTSTSAPLSIRKCRRAEFGRARDPGAKEERYH